VAAFGIVLLSRVYGAARSAALARLVPPTGLRLSQAAARAAVAATVAGAAAAVLGGIAAAIGPQWPLRLGSLVFLVGAVVALVLPPLADTEPPEVLPRPFGVPWRSRTGEGNSVLSGRLVGVTLLGSAGLRLLYGFLLLFLAFAIRSGAINGGDIAGPYVQLALIASAFGLGTLIATGIGTAIRVGRPIPLQATGIVLVAVAALYASVRFSFISLLVLCLCTALASGLGKVAVDASIQERIPEPYRPNAFARTETLLMLVWLAGAGIGLVPHVNIRFGVAVAALAALMAMIASVMAAWRLRGEMLGGPPATGPGGLVTGVLLQPGAHVKALPPAPVNAAPPIALPAAPVMPMPSPVAMPAAYATNPPVVDAIVVSPSTPLVPPGYHVFHPSPPEAPPAAGPAPAAGA
jgi:hypothetical protein